MSDKEATLMQPTGWSMYGLLVALRQGELLDEAAERRRARVAQARGKGEGMSLGLPRVRREH